MENFIFFLYIERVPFFIRIQLRMGFQFLFSQDLNIFFCNFDTIWPPMLVHIMILFDISILEDDAAEDQL